MKEDFKVWFSLKKIVISLLFVFCCVINLSAREIVSESNPNLSVADIVYAFYSYHCSFESSARHYAITGWHVETDSTRQNFNWTLQEDEYDNCTNLFLWVDNGWIRITYYPKKITYTDGSTTWNLQDTVGYYKFRYQFVKTLSNFFSLCQIEKKKHGGSFTQEENDAMYYLMNLFYES